MTDDELARRVCGLVGWECCAAGEEALTVMLPSAPGRRARRAIVSWPDLSAAALRHVEGKGWRRLTVEVDDFDTTWTRLQRPIEEGGLRTWQHAKASVTGPASTALYRALCAACAQTEDA